MISPAPSAPWHRLHPLSPLIRAGRGLLGLLVVFAGTLFPGTHRGRGEVLARLGVAGLLVVFGVISWLVTRWRVEGSDLRIETGVVRRSSLRFPLSQIQAIDVVRPILARLLGLSELRLRMGGAEGGAGRLAYLTATQAETVRAELLSLARRSDDPPIEAPADGRGDPERVLLRLPVARLIRSMLVSPASLVVVVLGVALVSTAVVSPVAFIAILGSSGAAGLGLVTFFWRRLNGAYNLTLAEAPDGLRLRSGLLDTTAETIPNGRIQAVRMVEPLLWRPFGWCRVEVDVAGRHRREGEGSPESRQLRALLPVGTREEARLILGRILPGAPEAVLVPPTRARYKSPLRYHNLAWGQTTTCVVTSSGRVARVTSWVPLAKVQSLRLVQGPLQRRLRLATVYLDTAGHSVHAAIRDTDQVEAGRLLGELSDLARAARR